jgi:hypothetical protein
MITIDKNFSGFEKDINIQMFKFDIKISDDKNLDINKILKLHKIDEIKDIKHVYRKLLHNLHLKNVTDIDWQNLIGRSLYNKRVDEVKSTIQKLKYIDEEYLDVLFKRYKLTNGIGKCYFDGNKYETPVYDHVSSKTGRTVIKSGLNFLTMKKEERLKLQSSYKDGAIFEIDIVSLEPRVLAKITRGDEVYDIYEHISNEILNKKYSRKNVKLGLISSLYGASPKTVKKLSGLDIDAVRKIKSWFKVEDFITSNFSSDKKEDIINFYGRKVFNSESKLNHYLQSTATDCALLSFLNLMNDLPKQVKLIGIIHDSVILDVDKKNINTVSKLRYLKEDRLKIKLPVKVERLS